MSDTLLDIIARLQEQHMTSSQGRRLLLDYARKRARARLGLLFIFDPARQKLLLIEQIGQAPRRMSESDAAEIAPGGLFGIALQQQRLISINEGDHDARALPAEQAFMWPDGQVLLCAVGVVAREDANAAPGEPRPQDQRQGVMVLCAGPRATTAPAPLLKHVEQDILLCSALLGSYLDASPDATRPPDAHPLDAHEGHPYISPGPSTSPHDDTPHRTGAGVGESTHVGMPLVGIRGAGGIRPVSIPSMGIRIDYPYILRALTAFYEAGLVDGARDEQGVCQFVVDALRNALDTESGIVWLYASSLGQFVRCAGLGQDSGFAGLVESELEQVAAWLHRREHIDEVAMHGGGAVRVITWSPERMVVLGLLQYSEHPAGVVSVVGALALGIEGRRDFSEEQRLLLEQLCRAAALVIHNAQLRAAERQAAVDTERGRIARDIHDGAAQQIAQAIHTLEYAVRIVDKRPAAARQEIGQARKILVESLSSLRQSIATLLPARLEQASLGEALATLLDEFRRANPGIAVHYEDAHIKHWPPSLEIPIYRLVREALRNVRKHAHATQVTVQLQALPGMAVVQVSDNGAGFAIDQARRNTSAQRPHFGLRSMQERVEQVGGTFTLTSKPGEGTSIKASFPLPAQATTLTTREREVLRVLVEGASNRMIAERLSVSIETVKSHMHHIMQKLGVKDRTQAAVLAARHQWV